MQIEITHAEGKSIHYSFGATSLPPGLNKAGVEHIASITQAANTDFEKLLLVWTDEVTNESVHATLAELVAFHKNWTD